jgi:hypothetical protein
MLSLLRDAECQACGTRHNFCLAFGELVPSRPYDYVCPQTGKPARLQSSHAGEAVAHYPQGAVNLNAAPMQQAA